LSAHVVSAPLLGAPHLHHQPPALAFFQVRPRPLHGWPLHLAFSPSHRTIHPTTNPSPSRPSCPPNKSIHPLIDLIPQGDVSPESDPGRYLQSLHQLLAWYWSAAPGAAAGAWPPLVVNTHGWVAGVGLELLGELLRAVEPSHGGRAGAALGVV
jgi:hypothetical protein